jgi:hypothetical protein
MVQIEQLQREILVGEDEWKVNCMALQWQEP